MPEAVKVTLEPSAMLLQSGGDTAEALATVHNLGEVLDQYDLEIEGLDRTWYTIHAPTVGLFPGDNSQVRLSFHPPKRSDIRAGDYPFLLKAVSQVSRDRTGSVRGALKIQPFAVFKAEINPQRLTARRSGGYRVTISNSGSVDLTLDLKGADKEGLCRFSFGPETLVVAPGERANTSMKVSPKRGWLTGPAKAFDFTVAVAPQGARGDVKTLNGSLVHRPFLSSWSPILSLFKTLLVILIFGSGVVFALRLGGGLSGYQIGLTRLWHQAVEFVAGPSGPSRPAAGGPLIYTEGFKAMHDADPKLVGDPIENVLYDVVGNGYQNSKNGTLFWLKSTNTVYFFTKEVVYVFRDEKIQPLDVKPRQ